MSETIVVAGATGHLGRNVVDVLLEREYLVRGIGHRHSIPPRDGLTTYAADLRVDVPFEAVNGADCLISCVGAPIRLEERGEKARFDEVDYQANERLFVAAARAGVARVIYVSLVNAHLFMQSEYVRSHERSVSEARQSPMMQTIVRTTPLFSLFTPMVGEARRTGRVRVFGDGSGRTNPIADRDLADVIADAVRNQPHEITAGGPETFSRERIAEMACEAAGVEPRVSHTPALLASLQSRLRKPFNPRLAEAIRFHAMYSEVDALADAVGKRTLQDAFAEAAAIGSSPAQPGDRKRD